jgi:hypothetical protein
LGRVLFGVTYGLSTVALYQLLGSHGLPTFYDKTLQVPLMNLSVGWFDRVGRAPTLRWLDPERWTQGLAPSSRHLAYISVWAAVFLGLSMVQGVGDQHPGQWMPFWQQACREGRDYACPYLADLEMQACRRGSQWACNQAGSPDVKVGEPILADLPILLQGSKGEIRLRAPEELYAEACRQGWELSGHCR